MNYKRIFTKRIETVSNKLKTLHELESILSLGKEYNLTRSQWDSLNSCLYNMETVIRTLLKRVAGLFFKYPDSQDTLRKINRMLGKIELRMSKAFSFFDTYLDVISQRKADYLGGILKGCDTLARDALIREHPILKNLEDPIVYCDRGFGASIIREGVSYSNLASNPMPLIQIPYSKLKEKYNLVSILHEAGHEAAVRLKLTTLAPEIIRSVLTEKRAPTFIRDLYCLWSSEIVPDFWAFCCSGMAQPLCLADILSLPEEKVFAYSLMDPHPMPFIRVHLSFGFCEEMWGSRLNGLQDWTDYWNCMYPLESAGEDAMTVIKTALKFKKLIINRLFELKLKFVDNLGITNLFNFDKINPANQKKRLTNKNSFKADLKGLNPCAQLSLFRYIRDNTEISEKALDRHMTLWLTNIN